MFYLHICLCAACVPGAPGEQKVALDYHKEELQMAVNYHAVLKIEPRTTERAVSALNLRPLSSPGPHLKHHSQGFF